MKSYIRAPIRRGYEINLDQQEECRMETNPRL